MTYQDAREALNKLHRYSFGEDSEIDRNGIGLLVQTISDELTRLGGPAPAPMPFEDQVELVGQAIRTALRPERKNNGPLLYDHDVYEYQNAAVLALAEVGVVGELN